MDLYVGRRRLLWFNWGASLYATTLYYILSPPLRPFSSDPPPQCPIDLRLPHTKLRPSSSSLHIRLSVNAAPRTTDLRALDSLFAGLIRASANTDVALSAVRGDWLLAWPLAVGAAWGVVGAETFLCKGLVSMSRAESISLLNKDELWNDVVETKRQEDILSACCLRNFSLAPEPPGTFDILEDCSRGL